LTSLEALELICNRQSSDQQLTTIAMQARLKSQLWSWLPVLLWLALICIESTSMLSSANTGGVLYGIIATVFGPVDRKSFEEFHSFLRKTGHFLGYAVLSLLFFRALVRSFTWQARRTIGEQKKIGLTTYYTRMAALASILTLVVASLDEWHQTFLPSRTGAFHDVLLDCSGAVIIQLIALAFLRRRNASMHGTETPL
jgi:VanZ family protein